jgi:hypothetical protein
MSPLIETIRASVIGDHEVMELPAAEQGLRVPDAEATDGQSADGPARYSFFLEAGPPMWNVRVEVSVPRHADGMMVSGRYGTLG